MLLYKFFFFNYVMQLSGEDLFKSLGSTETDNPLEPFAENLAQIG